MSPSQPTPPENPFIGRLTSLVDDKALESALSILAIPIEGLGGLPVEVAVPLLLKHLEGFYSPNGQGIALVKRILATGWAYGIGAYPDIPTYIRRSTSDRIAVNAEPITWGATGLAGAGKSAVLAALQHVLDDAPIYRASEHCPARPLRIGLILKITGRPTKISIINLLLEVLGLPPGVPRNQDNLIRQIQLELYRQGCLFIVLDESQAVANGATAGAAFVNFVAEVRKFGLPVVVVGNYSMFWGISNQHSQNLQRMLVDPFVMQPYISDDPFYIAHLRQLKVSCGGVLNIDPVADAADINRWTGGQSRSLVNLVCIAYRMSRVAEPSRPAVVNTAALESAYSSNAYGVFRTEIELVRDHLLTGKKIRKDLMCPFELVGDSAETDRSLRRQALKDQVAQQKVLSLMTPAEHAAIKDGTLAAPEFLASDLRSATPPAKQPASTAESMGIKNNQPRNGGKRRPPPTAADASRGWGS